MKEDINLASQKPAETAAKKISQPIIVVFAVVVVVAVVLIGFSFFLSTQSDSLTEDANSLKSNISKSEKKQKIQVVSERLAAISSVLATRSFVNTISSKVAASVPQNFSIEALSGDSQEITLDISSNDLAGFANYLEKDLPAFIKENKSNVASVAINDFSQSPSGYNLSLSFKVTLNK